MAAVRWDDMSPAKRAFHDTPNGEGATDMICVIHNLYGICICISAAAAGKKTLLSAIVVNCVYMKTGGPHYWLLQTRE